MPVEYFSPSYWSFSEALSPVVEDYFTKLFRGIRDHVRSKIENPLEIPTQYDNLPLTAVGSNVVIDEPTDVDWLRCNIQLATSNQVTIGAPGRNRFRHPGVVTLQVFLRINTGEAKANAAYSAAMGPQSLRSYVHSSEGVRVRFLTPSRTTVGRREGVWQVNIVCPFFADELA